jgi:hypothetical protein
MGRDVTRARAPPDWARVSLVGSKLNLPVRRAQEAASGCPAPARSVSTRSSNVPMAPTGRLWAAKSPRIACLWHHRHVSRGDRNGTQRGTRRPGTTRFPARHGSVPGQAPHLPGQAPHLVNPVPPMIARVPVPVRTGETASRWRKSLLCRRLGPRIRRHECWGQEGHTAPVPVHVTPSWRHRQKGCPAGSV